MTESPVKVRHLSDVVVPGVDCAIKLEIDELLGREVIVDTVEYADGDNGRYAIIHGELGGRKIVFTTGSTIVLPKLVLGQGSLPLIMVFSKSGRAYDVA